MWAKIKIDHSDGVHLLKSLTWETTEATCVIKTDACPEGLAFWYPGLNLGFTTRTPRHTLSNQIIFYEALAVLSAINDARFRLKAPR